MKIFSLLVFLSLVGNSFSINLTITLTNIPSNTPANDQIYISGNFNNWRIGNAEDILILQSNGTRKIILQNVTGTIEFKFNRGNWNTPEGTSTGTYSPNRTYNTANGSNLNLTIDGWEDLTGNNGSTANANVLILNTSFFIPQLNTTRRIWLFLPNDYQTALQKRYPVIYMHDGQNLFDQATSFSGEWGVDETLAQLQNQGDYGAIVVGIDNGGSTRIDEYSPWINPQYGGGKGDEYVAFIVNTLKPYIDQYYRTLTTSQNTGIIGSSMGGLISLYAVSEYPNVFGKAGIFSPSIWFANANVQSQIESKNYSSTPLRLYFLSGTNESTSMVPDMQNARNLFVNQGVPDLSAKLITHADGEHSEWYWKREFGAAYQFLFPAPVNETNALLEFNEENIFVYPNPISDEFTIQTSDGAEWSCKVTTLDGKEIFTGKNKGSKWVISTNNWSKGTYIVTIFKEEKIYIKKIQIP